MPNDTPAASNHSKPSEGADGASSTSDAVAEQVNSPELVLPLAVMLAVTVGRVFSTVTDAESDAVPPKASLAETVQVTVSPGETMVLSRLMESPE